MLPSVLQVVLISAIPVGAAFIGATVAARHPPGRIVQSSIQHFAAVEKKVRKAAKKTAKKAAETK